MKKIILSIALSAAFTLANAQTTWTIDNTHSSVGFSVSHLVISEVEGSFKDFNASVMSHSEDFEGSEVKFNAKVASIDTDNEQRDGHLKSEDFFDAEKHPELSFNGKVIKNGKKYILKGQLTMRGTTRDVTFNVKYNGTVKDPYCNIKSGFKITGEINRKDYGLKWGALTEAGGAVVGDEVTINCNIQLQKQG